ncbi:hypothetical protein DVP80_03530 [Yersinia enterocolitica]|nr:hypothetical protein [Yersinia enterocolitica]EKN6268171.1 hypothetical protein [Yersinia enterocolitica]
MLLGYGLGLLPTASSPSQLVSALFKEPLAIHGNNFKILWIIIFISSLITDLFNRVNSALLSPVILPIINSLLCVNFFPFWPITR